MPHSFNSLMLIPQLCIAHCAGSSWPVGLWCLLRLGRALPYHETHNHQTQSQGDFDMLRILILGVPFSNHVIKLDQLAMQRGKDLVQVSLVIGENKMRVTKFKFLHLIIWCAVCLSLLRQYSWSWAPGKYLQVILRHKFKIEMWSEELSNLVSRIVLCK